MSTRLYNVMNKLVSRLENFDGTIREWMKTNIGDNIDTRTLLWTNPNPTASFSAQSISVPCSDYDFIEILVTGISANTQFNIFRATTDGTNNWMLFQNNDNQGATNVNGFRIYGVHSTYVQFLDAYFNNAMNNNYLVPQRVWGIKNVKL